MAFKLPCWVQKTVFVSILAIIASGCSIVPNETVSNPSGQAQQQETIDKPVDVQLLHQRAVNRRIGRWAVVIGISQYKYNTAWNPHKGIQDLRYAHQDARAFSDFLKSPAGGGFSDDRVVLLTNQAATVKEVRKAIGDFLAQSLEDDLVILFFAGHGSPDPKNPQNLYLLSHDTEPDNFYGTALPMWEIDVALTRSIRSKRVFILADACHSAGVGSTRAILVANRINTYMDALAQSKKGVTKITASRANELSQEKEFPEGGHGVFTHYLLEGLQGKADDNRDGFVTMEEAYQYLFDRVRSETRHSQNPWSSSYLNNDIPIGIVDSQVQTAIRARMNIRTKETTVSKKYEPAMAPKKKIEDRYEKAFEKHLALAESYISNHQFKSAEKELNKAEGIVHQARSEFGIRLNADRIVQLRVAAERSEKHRQWEEAYRRAEAEAKKRPPREKIKIWIRFLKENRDIHDTEEASRIYNSIRQKIRPNIQRHYDRLLSEMRRAFKNRQFPHALEKLDAAEALLHEANNELHLNIDPRNIDTIRSRFLVHASGRREYDQWNRTERRAKAIDLNEPGDYKRRISIYKKFMRTQPGNPYRWNASQKISALNRELKQFKENRFHESMEQAEILLSQGDYDGALEFLEMARKYATPEQYRELKKLAGKYGVKTKPWSIFNKNKVDWIYDNRKEFPDKDGSGEKNAGGVENRGSDGDGDDSGNDSDSGDRDGGHEGGESESENSDNSDDSS